MIITVVVYEAGNTAQCVRLLELTIASPSTLCTTDLNIVTYTIPWNSRWAADVCSDGEDLLLLSDPKFHYRGHKGPSLQPMPESGEIFHCYLYIKMHLPLLKRHSSVLNNDLPISTAVPKRSPLSCISFLLTLRWGLCHLYRMAFISQRTQEPVHLAFPKP